MIDLYVYSRDRVILGEISEHESLEIEENYEDVSKLVLRVPKTPLNASLLKIGNILTEAEKPNYGYIIDHFSSIKEESELIEVYAYSLNWLLSFRAIPRQLRFIGDVRDVIYNFVKYTCIEVDAEKVIPDLSLGTSNLIGSSVDSSKSGGSVLEQAFSVANEAECTLNVLMGSNDLYLDVYRGQDRSIEQNQNEPVTFSEEFDNVLNQSYFDSLLNFKNVAVVAGEGEGVNRSVVEVSIETNVSGLDRRELYVDARDISRTYYDEDNNEVTVTESEYEELLKQRGLEKLKEYNRITTFETTVDDVQYVLGVDYFLGDKVTFIDNDLGIVMNSRVTSIKTVSNKEGVLRSPSFGTGLPRRLQTLEV